METRMTTGVFVGLITLDCIYQTRRSLQPNEKQVAEAMLLAAGGPATNAAIAFQALGGQARLVGALGQHPLTTVVRDDLAQQGVELVDLTPTATEPPPFSSIVVNVETGDRAVISRNAADRPMPRAPFPNTLLDQADCLLLDGHQMALGCHLAQLARPQQLPVVIDAGSWKPGFDQLLPFATTVIASANFHPPGTGTAAAAIAYLRSLNVSQIAVTRGGEALLYQTESSAGSQSGTGPVSAIKPMETLGAGDIFHGAFCYYATQTADFVTALHRSAAVATLACQSWGTRRWIKQLPLATGPLDQSPQ